MVNKSVKCLSAQISQKDCFCVCVWGGGAGFRTGNSITHLTWPHLLFIVQIRVSLTYLFHKTLKLPIIIPRGVYSFRLSVRPFVCSFVRSFIRNFVPFMELLQSFTLKQLKWSISRQSLIRKHSYLDHRFPGGSAFIPWFLTPGSMPRAGATGQI